jgi:hypothetical protein
MPCLIKCLIKWLIKNDDQGVAVNESERWRPGKFGGENVGTLNYEI